MYIYIQTRVDIELSRLMPGQVCCIRLEISLEYILSNNKYSYSRVTSMIKFHVAGVMKLLLISSLLALVGC